MAIFESDDIAMIEELENFYNTEHQSLAEYAAHEEQTHEKIQFIKNRSSSDKTNKSANAEMSKE